jgi:ribonuclease H2 subunit B
MFVLQRDGSLGNFRPMQDIIEEVSATIADASEKDAQKDPSLNVSADDIVSFLSLDFVQSSIKRVCDVKGECFECYTIVY